MFEMNNVTGVITFDGASIAGALVSNAQTGTSYTTVLTDASKFVTMSNASPNTLTIPPNSSVAYSIGTTIHVKQAGAGQTTIAPGAGVTINNVGSLLLRTQNSTVTLFKEDTDIWTIAGDVDLAYIAKTDVAQEYTAQQNFNEATLTDATTITWDADTQQEAVVTLTASRILGAISNQKAGSWYHLRVIQGGAGSFALSYDANYKFGTAGAPTLSTAASSEDVLAFRSNGTVMQYMGAAIGVHA